MSTSDQDKLRLNVYTEDAAAEIFVIDAHFHLADHGLGPRKTFLLDPGIYTVKVRTGSQTQEDYAVLRRGEAESVVKEFPALRFASPAPLYDTAKTHEYHMTAADAESRTTHVQAGQGSWIFVFARDWTPPNRPSISLAPDRHPARGLTLRDAQGNLVAEFATQSKSDLTGDPWAACNVQVNPGIYHLRLEMASGATLEQTIVASSHWQTQVFLLQRAYGADRSDRRADLPGASVLLSNGPYFDSHNHDLRLVDLARLGLTNQRRVLSEDMRMMLRGKFDNPMLGIYAGHLLLLDEKLDLDLLHIVVGNLRGLLGPHPDVEALALLLEPGGSPYVFEVPPMLRRSWSLVLNATVTKPWLVPLGSLAANVADRLWAEEPWLLWMNPPTADPAQQPAATLGDDQAPELSDVEAALQTQLSLARKRNDTPAPMAPLVLGLDQEPQPSALPPTPRLDEDTIQRLVQVLGIPRANVEDLVDKLDRKAGNKPE